jgi:hypothetical protein
MPQRVNSRSDIGNTKIASDTYDVNNCFLTDQGWVYRHYKGDPATTKRYWDEIIVAGEVDKDDTDNAPVKEIQYSAETSGGSLLVTTPDFEGAPDDIKDIDYSAHTYEGTLKPATPVPASIYKDDGTPMSPGPSPDGFTQFPAIRSVSAPPADPDGGDGSGDDSDA